MSNDIAFLAEFADGKPQRSALELAAGAAELAAASGGAAVGLAYGSGAKSGAAAFPSFSAHASTRAVSSRCMLATSRLSRSATSSRIT